MKIQSEVQKSAVQTLEVLAKGFGAEHIKVDFSDADLIQTDVKYLPMEAVKTDDDNIEKTD